MTQGYSSTVSVVVFDPLVAGVYPSVDFLVSGNYRNWLRWISYRFPMQNALLVSNSIISNVKFSKGPIISSIRPHQRFQNY